MLFTYDIVRFYPSIDIKDALVTLNKALPVIFGPDNNFLLRILELIMVKNYVTVDNRVFKQIWSTATGTAVAPAFANLYLWAKFRPIFARYATRIILQRRYIDDGVRMARDEQMVHDMIRDLNTCSNLDLTYEISKEEVVYLDVRIYKGQRWAESRVLDVCIYTKPISKFLYLHTTSNHPQHVFEGAIKGELISCHATQDVGRSWFHSMPLLIVVVLMSTYIIYSVCIIVSPTSICWKHFL